LPKINFEKIVKADRKKVFDIVANYEQFQKMLPEHFISIKVKSVRDNVAVVEEHVILAGIEFVMTTKHVTKYPEIHEVFVIGGDTKGSHVIEKYETIKNGTKITVDADIKLKGKLKILGIFGKNKIKNGLEKIIDELAKIAEN